MADALAELVKKAKGDRSIREYAKAADVDAGLLSKIINGKNLSPTSKVPSLNVLKKLTSPEAGPRGGVTYEKLVKVADSSKQYQSGLKAGLVAASTLGVVGSLSAAVAGIATVGATALASNMFVEKQNGYAGYDYSMADKLRFVVISKGLILGALGGDGIRFAIENENTEISETTISIDGQVISEYTLKYVFLSDKQREMTGYAETMFRLYMQELVFTKPSNKRKVTIVLNDADAYKALLAFKSNNSYNGELSILLVDTDKVKLVKEDYISHYAGSDSPEEIILV